MGRSDMYNSSALTIGCFSFSYRSKIIITKYYNSLSTSGKRITPIHKSVILFNTFK